MDSRDVAMFFAGRFFIDHLYVANALWAGATFSLRPYASTADTRALGRGVGECAWTGRQDAIFQPSGSPKSRLEELMQASGSLLGMKVEGARAIRPALAFPA